MARLGALFVASLALAGLAAFASGSSAQAWVGMGPTWPGDTNYYDRHTLPSSWVSGLTSSASQWNNVTPSPFVWVSNSNSNNDITRGSIDGGGGTLGVTTVWYSGSNITRATVKFDSAENWYLGSGTPGAQQVDYRSVATHEMGHALGLAHTQSTNCPNNSNKATMCPTYTLGTTYMRSLEVDDRNGANALYP